MNLLVNGQNYELLERAENVVGQNIINEGLELCRKMIENHLFNHYVEEIDFDGIYVYDSMDVNAIAWHEGGAYGIAFSTAFFVKLHQWHELWKKSPKIEQIFLFETTEIRDTFFLNSYWFGVMFALAHEMSHILNGHCLFVKNGNRIVESQQQSIENNIFNQALEYDADFTASRICMARVISIAQGTEARAMLIRNYLFALYNIFLLFEQSDKDTFEHLMKERFDRYDHPSAGIRISYCLVATLDYLNNFETYEQIAPNYYQAVNDCVSFEKIVIEHKELKECLYTYAFTEKGAQHIKLIHNKCRKLEKSLRKYTIMPLFNYPIMNKLPFWVSEDGDFVFR